MGGGSVVKRGTCTLKTFSVLVAGWKRRLLELVECWRRWSVSVGGRGD